VLNGLLGIDGVGLGVGSRILAVKRPDLFVTLNAANKTLVRKLFGAAPFSVRRYLAWHEQIWAFPWWSAPEPRVGRDEKRVWRARVALLDALLYDVPESGGMGPGFRSS
jgi:hypothetical protein